MKKILFAFAIMTFGTAVFTSCKKELKTTEINTATEDLAIDQDDLEAVDLDADEIVSDRGGNGSCPTLTWADTSGNWPNTLTIDFGTACTRPDGRVVSGKIIVNQTAEMSQIGATRTLNFDNFFVDDVQFLGSRIRVNNGPNASGQPTNTVSVTDLQRIFPDGTSTLRNSTHVFTWAEGSNTPAVRLDDVIEITGTGTFTGREGNTFSSEILTPLRKEFSCRWIVSGTAEITRNGQTGSIDFGDGNCDRKATVTGPNGNTRVINLRK